MARWKLINVKPCYLRLLTEAFNVVKKVRNSDSGLDMDSIMKSHLELFELVLVFSDLAINLQHETVFEASFLCRCI